jgi:hypothetical protein
MSISMYNSSVVVFTQFLGSLSHLLDRAADHAETRKIDPSILLNSRLYPTMYSLTRQVGEAIRHVVLSCSLLTGVEPPVFPDTEPDILELKARIATAVEFIRSLPPALINGAADKAVVFTFRNGSTREFTGQSLLLTFSVAAVLFPRHNGLRHPAPLRRRSRQERFFGNANPTTGRLSELDFAAVFTDKVSGGRASGHLAFELFESSPRLALAIVHKPDRRVPRHRPAADSC